MIFKKKKKIKLYIKNYLKKKKNIYKNYKIIS